MAETHKGIIVLTQVLLDCVHQGVPSFRHITELESQGVNRTDINKLMEAGFCTVQAVSPHQEQGLQRWASL